MATVGEWDEETRGGIPSAVSRTVPPVSADLHEAVGQLMAETVRQGRRVDEFGRQLQFVIADLKRERPELVDTASRATAGRTSNRMAALLGALFVLYTEAAPVLHELWKGMHR